MKGLGMKGLGLNRLVSLGCLLGMVMGAFSAQAADAFTDKYKNGTRCGSTYSITGKEPTASGKYPVFLYMVGTTESYTNAAAMAAVDGMADAGYVAATIQYPNTTFGNCSALSDKAKCIFTPSSANSAVAKLCARAKADCTKGIVVAGFSQGSIMAILAKNFDARVQAAYGIGAGVQYSTYDIRACVANGKRTLTSDRLRAVNGEADDFMGKNANSVRAQLQELTGLTCTSTSYSCFRSNQSGWVMASHAEVEDGAADHCYMRVGGCLGSQSVLDEGWELGSAPWTVDPNLQWLTTFTTK